MSHERDERGERDEIPLLSADEAVAEVRRWLEVEGFDPEGVFTGFGERTIRYKDLIPLLEEGAADGELLRFAISRGRAMQRPGRRASGLLQIRRQPGAPPEPEAEDDA